MEKQIINPWKYQDKFGYAQALEIKHVENTLYCSGQAAMDAEGQPSSGDMETQLRQAIQNLEKVVTEAGYQCQGIVRLNIFTTSAAELFTCFHVFTEWIDRHRSYKAE